MNECCSRQQDAKECGTNRGSSVRIEGVARVEPLMERELMKRNLLASVPKLTSNIGSESRGKTRASERECIFRQHDLEKKVTTLPPGSRIERDRRGWSACESLSLEPGRRRILVMLDATLNCYNARTEQELDAHRMGHRSDSSRHQVVELIADNACPLLQHRKSEKS
ncbi:hypothetical protein CHS0354_005907 [Potamilus streckersoni]|uniref:Uncharacterized protein n=1 Tax=Potamilus streckersoni TaxID=2493646 RepID=A0AAE0W545_9BIVA|nr:hypothetical protein CHS0354_005907 [Potamilus streckersoni]